MLEITNAARTLLSREARRRGRHSIALFAPWRGYRLVGRVFAAWRHEDALRDDPDFIPLSLGLPVPVYAEARVIPLLRSKPHQLEAVTSLFGVAPNLIARDR
jgi:hypothetical protein